MLADGCSFQANSNRSLVAPRQCGDVEHAHELKRRFFWPSPAVALCAVSLIMRDLLTDLGHLGGKPARPVDQDYEHPYQNLP